MSADGGQRADREILVDGGAVAPDPATELGWTDEGRRAAILRHGTDRELVVIEGGPGDWVVIIRGRRIPVSVRSHRDRLLAASSQMAGAHHGPSDVLATLPGLVVRVLVAEGQAVAAGEPLVTIEAMKMQNEIRAPRGGRVELVGVSPGQTIGTGVLLVRLADSGP